MGCSVRGASHVRAGSPNQDSIGWLETPDAGGGLLLALADGHGSAKCPRSEQGARFAVEAAKAVLGAADLEALPELLVRRWREMVENHLKEEPLEVSRLEAVEQKLGRAARCSVEADPWVAYGTTLLAAAVTGTSVLYLQLGDGDILTIAENGEVSRPWARDERLLGNETTSMATRDASSEIRIHVTREPEELPELILLSTDGYANSFREEGGFLAVGEDLLRMIRSEGVGPIQGNLEEWLREASEFGSGDDITAGILWRAA